MQTPVTIFMETKEAQREVICRCFGSGHMSVAILTKSQYHLPEFKAQLCPPKIKLNKMLVEYSEFVLYELNFKTHK